MIRANDDYIGSIQSNRRQKLRLVPNRHNILEGGRCSRTLSGLVRVLGFSIHNVLSRRLLC